MPVHNLAADRQADTGSFVFVAPVQALENLKNAIAIFFVEADAVVFHADLPTGRRAVPERLRLAIHFHHRTLAGLAKLQPVADEVLEKLRHLAAIAQDGRQRADVHAPLRVLDAHFEIGNHRANHVAQIHRRERLGITGHARQAEQILNQHLHSRRRVLHARQIIQTLRTQPRFVLGLQPIAKRLDLAQRLLQIVRCHVGKLLQLGV